MITLDFSCAIDTPDAAYDVLIAAGFKPCAGGWRDPDDGDVVRWGEALRRARRRVRMCSCSASASEADEGHALACELVWGSAEGSAGEGP